MQWKCVQYNSFFYFSQSSGCLFPSEQSVCVNYLLSLKYCILCSIYKPHIFAAITTYIMLCPFTYSIWVLIRILYKLLIQKSNAKQAILTPVPCIFIICNSTNDCTILKLLITYNYIWFALTCFDVNTSSSGRSLCLAKITYIVDLDKM